jgi:hypothetical protein
VRLRDAGAVRTSLAAAAVYAILALAMFGQGLLPGRVLSASDRLWTAVPWSAAAPPLSRPFASNFELGDSVVVFEPFVEHTRESLPHLPLWNPYVMAGRPFLANGQSAVLSPFSVPSYLVPRRVSFAAVAMLKVFVAALGTFLLARALGFGFAGALLAGLVYGFGQFTVDWVTWPQSSVRALLPWLLLATDRVVAKPHALPSAALAAAVALQFFGGHPETSYEVLVVAFAFALFRLVELRRAGRAVLRPAAAFVTAVLAGTALAAVVIVPFVELLLHSSDLESRKALSGGHVAAKYLLGVLMPGYWGRPTQTASPLEDTLMVDRAFYTGALPLMLAVGALLRPSVRRIALGVFGLGSLAVVVGFEPFLSIAAAFPGPVRTDRLTYLFLFAVALLAGRCLDDLVGGRLGPLRHRTLLAVGTALVCFPLVYVALVDWTRFKYLGAGVELAWGFQLPSELLERASRDKVIEVAALLEWLPLAAAGLTLLALRARRPLGAPVFVALAMALTAIDLFKIGMGYNPAIPSDQAFPPATGAIRELQGAGLARFVGIDPGGFVPVPSPLDPDLAMRYGIYDGRGRDFPVIDRYTTLWSRNIAAVNPIPRFGVPPPNDRALRALGLISVAYLMQSPQAPRLREQALTLVYDAGDARLYRNRHALPRAFVVDHQRVVGTAEDAVEAVESPDFDGRTTAITEERITGVRTAGPPERHSDGWASITSYAPERVVVRAGARRTSLLVLTDSWFPGWRAELDGRPAEVYRVNYLLRGVRLPAGTSEVTFTYRPTSYRLGWVTSLVAFLAILAAAFFGWRRPHVTNC